MADAYDDPFMKAFIGAAKKARPERPLRGAQEVKTALQQEIEAAWYGKKDPEQALADAAAKANGILSRG